MKRNSAEFCFHYKDRHPSTQKEAALGKKVVWH